jgi:RNase H-fold protein (predicted Holliday junction resolvase)
VTVLGVDPGTRKIGFAVVDTAGGRAPALGIIPVEALSERLREILVKTPVDVAAVGRGTNVTAIADAVRALGLRVELVDERETSLLARGRFFSDHPPRGWRRLIPRGMLLPERPIDDYAALLIAERFLASLTEGEE